VRVAQTGTFPKDFSWAVIETPQPPAVKVDDTKEEVRVTSGNIVARIRKSPLLIDFLRDIGDVLVADDTTSLWRGTTAACMSGRKCRRSRVTTDWETKLDP